MVKPEEALRLPWSVASSGFARSRGTHKLGETAPSWYRPRRYLHFDRPIGPAKAKRIVSDANAVASHAFYPLISYKVIKKKIKKDKATGKVDRTQKSRPIKYAAHVDSHIYAYYAHLLSPLYEAELQRRGLQESVLAFRSLGMSNIEFAGQVFDDIRAMQDCGVVALDVSGFFDSIDHAILKNSLQDLLKAVRLPADYYGVFRSITEFSFVDKVDLYELLGISFSHPRKTGPRLCSVKQFREVVRHSGLIQTNSDSFGIPQGTPISALLSNIYMLDFDQRIWQAVVEQGGKYYRYCDDIIVLAPPLWRDDIAGAAQREIRKLKLTINPSKTELISFKKVSGAIQADKPLQYLGFIFDGERILLRSAALARYSERMKRGVKLAVATTRKVNRIRSKRGLAPRPVFKRKLYARYSHFGARNFVTYGHRAAKILDSKAMRKQLKPLWGRLLSEIES